MNPIIPILSAIMAFCAFVTVAASALPEELSFKQLQGVDLSGKNFSGREMVMTDFSKANLRAANFTNAKVDRAEFTEADLSESTGWASADFGFGIDAQGAKFANADLKGANIPGTYFEKADFRGADLRGAFLSGRFHGANFEGAKVDGAVMLGAGGIESITEDLRMRGAVVDAKDFAEDVRQGRDFSGRHLDGFQLQGAILDGALFERSSLHSANLSGASMKKIRAAKALLAWVNADGASLAGADLSGAICAGINLQAADLSEANCRNVDFSGAKLASARFTNADLTGADFSYADLTGVDFSGAILLNTKWNAAIVERPIGLAPGEAERLHSAAARWKYDLSMAFNSAVSVLSFPVWIGSWLITAVVLAIAVRERNTRPWVVALMALHVAALLPLFCLMMVMSADVILTIGVMLISTIIAALVFVVATGISIKRRDKTLAKRVLPAAAGTILSLVSGLGVMGIIAAAMG